MRHRDHGSGSEPGEHFQAWTLDLVNGRHPTVEAVAYDRVEFSVGQAELVACTPNYRRRGLVRRLIGAAHARATERGLPVQGINGIQWFYRQCDYAARPGAVAVRTLRHREASMTRYAIDVLGSEDRRVAGVLVRSARVFEGYSVCCAASSRQMCRGSMLPVVLRHCHHAAVTMNESFRELSAGLGRVHPLHEAYPDLLATVRVTSASTSSLLRTTAAGSRTGAGTMLRACFPRLSCRACGA